MPAPDSGELPPLGEPTPARTAHRGDGAWYRRTPVVAAVGLLIGALAGFGVGRSLDDGAEETAMNRPSVQPSVVSPPTTVPTTQPALPDDCVEALRAAEEALQLLEQGFQNLQGFQFERMEDVLGDLARLRSLITARVLACQEHFRR